MAPNRHIVKFLEWAIYADRKDIRATVARTGLNALAGVHWAGQKACVLPHDLGLRKQWRLSVPVISVGNITVGGTGKSPTTQYLCKGLADRGLRPAALSYGYGGRLHGKFGVVSDNQSVLLTAEVAGDEPVMLANSLPGVPVLVCKNRRLSGAAAIQDMNANALVLDDGFQIRELYRDLNIVLVNSDGGFDNGRMLPAGKLREPLSGLARADCVLATGEWTPKRRDEMIATVRAHSDAAIYFGRFIPSTLVSLDGTRELSLDALRGRKVLALSSIANPTGFERSIQDLGASLSARERFADHHCYWAEDIACVNRSAVDSGSEMIITTDKDAVKLQGHDFAADAYALRIRLELSEDARFWRMLEDAISDEPC